MIKILSSQSCCCATIQEKNDHFSISKIKKTTKSFSSFFLTILIAFFPKCPICWAVYMSMFGSIGLAKLPYLKWMLPVLIIFLGIYLLSLLFNASRIGYMPFIINFFGAVTIILSRTFFPSEKWLLLLSITLIITGSLLNIFLQIPFKLRFINPNNNIKFLKCQ